MIIVSQCCKLAASTISQTAPIHYFDFIISIFKRLVFFSSYFGDGRFIAFCYPFIEIVKGSISIKLNNLSFTIVF